MSGRSRGRARTSTVPQPTPVTPPTGTTQTIPVQPARVASPIRAPVPPLEQTGRGRGVTQETTPSTVPTIQPGTVSPVSRSSGESPPQQPSPPHPGVTSGRAALRGAFNQPGVPTVIGAMERLQLEGTGDVQARREYRIEQVPYTRPASCVDKVGRAGTAIKILCNYFEVLSHPDWVLYQYHVDFLPVIDSRRMRQALLKNHDHLFPRNKAFDGSTIYSLDRLEEVQFFC